MHTMFLNVASVVVAFLLPFLFIVWPRIPRTPSSVVARWLLISCVGWILLAISGGIYGLLWEREYDLGRAPDSDPACTIAATVVFGWVFPLIGSLPSILIHGIFVYQKRRSQRLDNPKEDAEHVMDVNRP